MNLYLLNKNVVISNTSIKVDSKDLTNLKGKFIGLDEYGFCKIKQEKTNQIFALNNGRMNGVRNFVLGNWNFFSNNKNEENFKFLIFEEISAIYENTKNSEMDCLYSCWVIVAFLRIQVLLDVLYVKNGFVMEEELLLVTQLNIVFTFFTIVILIVIFIHKISSTYYYPLNSFKT